MFDVFKGKALWLKHDYEITADMQKDNMDDSENGTYENSSSISTSTKTMIPTLQGFRRGNKTTNRLKSVSIFLNKI